MQTVVICNNFYSALVERTLYKVFLFTFNYYKQNTAIHGWKAKIGRRMSNAERMPLGTQQ